MSMSTANASCPFCGDGTPYRVIPTGYTMMEYRGIPIENVRICAGCGTKYDCTDNMKIYSVKQKQTPMVSSDWNA